MWTDMCKVLKVSICLNNKQQLHPSDLSTTKQLGNKLNYPQTSKQTKTQIKDKH